MNLIYATSTDPRTLHRYSILSPEETLHANYDFAARKPISRMTRFGMSTIDPDTTVVVAYRNDQILVNDEILAVEPDVEYAAWIRSPPPIIPMSDIQYPLRSRVLHD